MKHPSIRLAVAALLLAAGCRGSDHPTAPDRDLPARPSFDMNEMDCQLTAEKCQIIQRGIDALKAHPNPTCQAYGERAQERYDAPSGEGFRGEPQYKDDNMSVYYDPFDGYTNVYPSFWTNPFINQDLATGALIAHEEYHHSGHLDEYGANRVQDMCLNLQA